MRAHLTRFLMLAALVPLIGSSAAASTVTIVWDPEAPGTVTNYTVFVGTAPKTYSSSVAVGTRTTWTFTGLRESQTYYFGVQAQNGGGVSPIAEIAHHVPAKALASSEAARSDFKGDGTFALLWQHRTTGQLATWQMTGAMLRSSAWMAPERVADTNWKLRGSADFNSDGKPDLLWQHTTTGELAVWFMDGHYMFQSAYLTPDRVGDPSWEIVALRDFNWDGHPDIIWQHRTTGELAVWFLRGTTVYHTQYLSIARVSDPGWRIVGSGDVDRDGSPDLLWQHATTGELAVWYMVGPTVVQTVYLTPNRVSDPAWRIVAVGDLDADGHIDLVWRHTETGSLAVWFLHRARAVHTQFLSPARVEDADWTLVGPR